MDDFQILPRLQHCVELLQMLARDSLCPSSKPLDTLLQNMLLQATEILGCEHASIWIINEANQSLSCLHSTNGSHENPEGYLIEKGLGLIGTCAEEEIPLMLDNVPQSSIICDFADKIMLKEIREIICSPMLSAGKLIAVLCVINRGQTALGKLSAIDQLMGQILAYIATDLLDRSKTANQAPEGVSAGKDSHTQAVATSVAKPRVIAASPQMQAQMELIRNSAQSPLLITGETGVGKFALAEWAHQISSCKHGPFIAIDLASTDESLWESELFGHTKGAFPGATEDKPGIIEQSIDGTLFLNEIGETPLPLQAKLMAFLDTGSIQRLGDKHVRRVQTRIIAATSREFNPEKQIHDFHGELYHRLAPVHVHIPPLRERPEDIIAMTGSHLARLASKMKKSPPLLAPSMREALLNANLRGNTNELLSLLVSAYQKCLASGDNTLQAEHLPPEPLDTEIATDPGKRYNHSDVSRDTTFLSLLTELLQMRPVAEQITILNVESNQPDTLIRPNQILKQPEILRDTLDKHLFAHSGKWNLSATYRHLRQNNQIDIGRRAFSNHVRNLFQNLTEKT